MVISPDGNISRVLNNRWDKKVSFERIIDYLNDGQTNYISFMFLIGLN